jgi:curved DNA-binding protein
MPTTIQDYYQTLGVAREATPEQIQAAFRKLARQYHPDVNKDPGAEEKFKAVGEAYEVLRDSDKRARYDKFGENWRDGQDSPPPNGWGDGVHVEYRHVSPDDLGFGNGDFSDLFESLFGGAARAQGPRRGDDLEGETTVTLEEAYRGTTRTLTVQQVVPGPDGKLQAVSRNIEVRIPAGVLDGTTLRLAGQGGPGEQGGAAGDLFVSVRLARHPTFQVDGRNLELEVPVAPWEAALGAEIPVPTLDGTVRTKLPAGTGSGKRLRLRGQGLPDRRGKRGDLYARVRIEVPKTLSEAEQAAWEELRRVSTFDPRQGAGRG